MIGFGFSLTRPRGKLAPVTVGPLSPGSAPSEDASFGTFVRTNPGDAQTANGTGATATLDSAGSFTRRIECPNFAPNIPGSATILGVKVECRFKHTGGGLRWYAMLTDENGDDLPFDEKTHLGPFSDSYAWYELGSASDPWGGDLTPTKLNGALSGVLIYFRCTGATAELDVDAVRVTYTYQP